MTAPAGPDRTAPARCIAGMTVGTDDGVIVLDLSTPEQPEHTRLRIERQTALDLCDQIMDAVDVLDGGRWW